MGGFARPLPDGLVGRPHWRVRDRLVVTGGGLTAAAVISLFLWEPKHRPGVSSDRRLTSPSRAFTTSRRLLTTSASAFGCLVQGETVRDNGHRVDPARGDQTDGLVEIGVVEARGPHGQFLR